jgi:hypothetical protein
VAAQARVALRAAAQRAADLGSYRRALAYLESGLLVVTDPADELDLRSLALDAAARAGLLDVGIDHGERAVAIATTLGRDTERRLIVARLANALTEGQQQRARELLNATISEPGFTADAPGYIEVATMLAKAEMRSVNLERAIELADATLPLASRGADVRVVLDLLITRGVAISNFGRELEAEVILTGALDVARRLGDPDLTNRAAVNLGFVLATDDVARAFEISRGAIEEAKSSGVMRSIRYILGNAVDSAIEVGEWDWAMDAMAELDALFTEPAERLWFGAYSGVIRAYRGEDVEADASRLYADSRRFDDPQYLTMGAYALAVSALMRGRLDEVRRLSEEAIGTLAGVDAAIFGARASIWSGDAATAGRLRDAFGRESAGARSIALVAAMDSGIAMLEGRRADARSHYFDAQHRFRELGTQLWLAMTDLDVVVTGAMEPEERRRAADEAREIFTRLRANALLGLLDAALAKAGDEHAPAPHAGEVGAREGLVQEA